MSVCMCTCVCARSCDWENLKQDSNLQGFTRFTRTRLFDPALSKGGAFTSLSKVGDLLSAAEHENEMLFTVWSPVKSKEGKKRITRSNSSVTKPLQTAWTKQHILNSDLVFSLVSCNFYYVTFQISMRLQWFLNCNAHLMLKMFTEAIVLLNQCASIWIFMVYFEGSFPLFCILYYSLFVLSFRRLCTGIINFCSRY